MTTSPSPYLAPGFYDRALAQGRHRAIVGGRWDETGRAQMAALLAEGMQPHHRLLDIGCGALRLGCRAVPWLEPGRYWGTDASAALMAIGHAQELASPERLPRAQLIEDAGFAFPGVPDSIDYAIAFAVFTHLPPETLRPALIRLRARCPGLTAVLFTVFLGDVPGPSRRQPDGVVTHADRPPYHRPESDVLADCAAAGFQGAFRHTVLPRGQRLCVAAPIAGRRTPPPAAAPPLPPVRAARPD